MVGVKHVFLATFFMALSAATAAQQYPTKYIRWIIPNAPGGTNSAVADVVAPRLAAVLGQQLVTDYRAGASGTIGTAIAAKATPDGYTLLLGISSPLVIVQNRPYDTDKDFAPISMITKSPSVLHGHPGSPFANVKEIIAFAKTNPGKLTYGHSGTGTFNHMAGEMFRFAAGIELVNVPYKGAGPALLAAMSKEVDFSMSNVPGAMPHIKANRLKGFAVTAQKRVPVLPNTPTMDEAGVPGFEADLWYCLLAPAGTPRPILEKLHSALVKVANSPDLTQHFASLGISPETSTPQELAKYMRSEVGKWKNIVEKLR